MLQFPGVEQNSTYPCLLSACKNLIISIYFSPGFAGDGVMHMHSLTSLHLSLEPIPALFHSPEVAQAWILESTPELTQMQHTHSGGTSISIKLI